MIRLVNLLLGLAASLVSYLDKRQLLEAGEAIAIKEGIQHAQDQVEKAKQARADAVRRYDEHGMSDDDPNRRD
tara:strand:- start:18167 stop:18385 length:219 start_codon:yes stop_codon:yes gene_type:complete